MPSIQPILIKADTIADYVPCLQTISNTIVLIVKLALETLLCAGAIKYKTIHNNRYLSHINDKSAALCALIALLPIIGIIIVKVLELDKKRTPRFDRGNQNLDLDDSDKTTGESFSHGMEIEYPKNHNGGFQSPNNNSDIGNSTFFPSLVSWQTESIFTNTKAHKYLERYPEAVKNIYNGDLFYRENPKVIFILNSIEQDLSRCQFYFEKCNLKGESDLIQIILEKIPKAAAEMIKYFANKATFFQICLMINTKTLKYLNLDEINICDKDLANCFIAYCNKSRINLNLENKNYNIKANNKTSLGTVFDSLSDDMKHRLMNFSYTNPEETNFLIHSLCDANGSNISYIQNELCEEFVTRCMKSMKSENIVFFLNSINEKSQSLFSNQSIVEQAISMNHKCAPIFIQKNTESTARDLFIVMVRTNTNCLDYYDQLNFESMNSEAKTDFKIGLFKAFSKGIWSYSIDDNKKRYLRQQKIGFDISAMEKALSTEKNPENRKNLFVSFAFDLEKNENELAFVKTSIEKYQFNKLPFLWIAFNPKATPFLNKNQLTTFVEGLIKDGIVTKCQPRYESSHKCPSLECRSHAWLRWDPNNILYLIYTLNKVLLYLEHDQLKLLDTDFIAKMATEYFRNHENMPTVLQCLPPEAQKRFITFINCLGIKKTQNTLYKMPKPLLFKIFDYFNSLLKVLENN